MNGLNDSYKKTAISQLLNPQQSSSYPSPSAIVPPGPAQSHNDQHGLPPFQQSYGLRAASWDRQDGGTERNQDNPPTPARSYQQNPHIPVTDVYGDQPSRAARSRVDDSNGFSVDVAVWHPPHEISNISYGPPVIAPLYSDERTAITGDYPPNNNFNQTYQQEPSTSTADWRTAEQPSTGAVRSTERRTELPPQTAYSMQPYYPPAEVAFGAAHFQHQPPAPKRPPPALEDVGTPKTKKPKTKAKPAAEGTTTTTASSKRGYNAKKRSEAAQIVAQNAQFMPTVSYAQVPSEKGKEKVADARMRIVSDESTQDPQASGPLHPELQFARCMSNRYKSELFPRCVSCTRRWAGDICRFQGIRFFLKDNQRNIVGISFVENQKADAPTMTFPTKWNIPLQPTHIRRTKRTIAQALLPTLRQELEHLSMAEIIRRPRESDVRATCDTCMTSIFSSSWMCRLCGREACAECFEQVKGLTEDRVGAGHAEIAALHAKRERHAHTNPFFLSCTRRNEHQAKDFSPMSRFCKDELSQAIKDMEALLLKSNEDDIPDVGMIDPALDSENSIQPTPSVKADLPMDSNNLTTGSVVHTPSDSSLTITSTESATANVQSNSPNTDSTVVKSTAGAADDEIPSHLTRRFTDAELTEDVFRPIWARGEPLVVTGLLPKFQIQWTPEYFREKYHSQACLVIECQTDVNKRVTVREFFSWFGQFEGRKECWKLKDWPPSTDFKIAFPELYEDFSNAVPVPNYVRRDGALNIASHFPSNTVAPDLGPKMYNALCSSQAAGSKGSTRLHMDMADAVNVMTYASLTPDGDPGCAAWDLYRAEDSDKIRQFLRKRFKGSFLHDPIHSQQFYLDVALRKELFDTIGVKSHRVYQRPGEAVFIPAGCAHQVCNLSDCIKVAVDFVSPENIARCEKLTKEFREQNQSMMWKEDVLQLRTMMWFAWLSCCRQES